MGKADFVRIYPGGSSFHATSPRLLHVLDILTSDEMAFKPLFIIVTKFIFRNWQTQAGSVHPKPTVQITSASSWVLAQRLVH